MFMPFNIFGCSWLSILIEICMACTASSSATFHRP
jgi:hypothetical protein